MCFAWAPRFELVWLSDAEAAHSRKLRATPTAAVAADDSRQTWGSPTAAPPARRPRSTPPASRP